MPASSDVTISELGDDDAGDVRALLVDLTLEDQGRYRDAPVTRERVEAVTGSPSRHFVGENHVYVARDRDRRAVGVLWCVLYDPGTGLEAELAELYVRPEARGRGIGGRLCQEALRLFRARGVTLASVWTHESNRAAMALYRRQGFSPTEHTVLTWHPGRRHRA